MPDDVQQDDPQNQDQTPDVGKLLASLFGQIQGPSAPQAAPAPAPAQGAPAPGNPLAQMVGLIAQARQQGAPEQQAPLPQVLGPAGTPSNQPYQPVQPQPQQSPPKTLSDYLSSAEVMHEGEKKQPPQNPLLQRPTEGWFKQQFNSPGSDYYVSPAKRMLQNFMIGLAALGGHSGFKTSYGQKYEEWQTDLHNAMTQETKDTQQQRADDINTRAQARIDSQKALQQDRDRLSDRDYFLKRGHLKTEETQAQARIDNALQAEKDRVAGRQQSLAQAAMPKVMKQATAEVQLAHKNAGDDLEDPGVQSQMQVEIGRRMAELQPKQFATDAMTKMDQAKELDGVDPLDLNGNMAAVDKSNVLSAEEKSNLKSYMRLNGTPASQNQMAVNRATAFTDNKVLPTVDKGTGEIGLTPQKTVRENPNQFGPPGPVEKAVKTGAIFTDIHSNMDRLREAWNAMPDQISNGLRVKLNYVMGETDPDRIHDFIQGKALEGLSHEEQSLVIRTGLAMENVLNLRGVAGMGQGSDMVRGAITRTVPGGTSANKKYALEQLDGIDNMVNQLQQGQLNVGNLTPQKPQLPGAPGTSMQRNNTTGLKDPATNQFRQFAKPEDSIQASKQDIQIKTTRNPNMTVRELAGVWQTGKAGKTEGYSAEDVAKDLGVSQNTKVSTLDAEQVARTLARFETGYGKAPAGKKSVFDPEGNPVFIDANKWDKAQKMGFKRR